MEITEQELKLLRKHASGEMLEWDDSEVSALRAAIRVILRIHEGFPRDGARNADDPSLKNEMRMTIGDCTFKLVPVKDPVP